MNEPKNNGIDPITEDFFARPGVIEQYDPEAVDMVTGKRGVKSRVWLTGTTFRDEVAIDVFTKLVIQSPSADLMQLAEQAYLAADALIVVRQQNLMKYRLKKTKEYMDATEAQEQQQASEPPGPKLVT